MNTKIKNGVEKSRQNGWSQLQDSKPAKPVLSGLQTHLQHGPDRTFFYSSYLIQQNKGNSELDS